jgi:peroxiredoxin
VELPRLEPLWNKYKERGFSVVAIEAARDTDRARTFIEENKLTYHMLENGEDNDVVDNIFNVHVFPTSYVVDKEGRVMYCHIGFEEGDEVSLEKEILSLFGETAPESE